MENVPESFTPPCPLDRGATMAERATITMIPLRQVMLGILRWLTQEERMQVNQLRLGRHISESIAVNRKARGWSQFQLARKAGVSWATIQRLERWWNADTTMETLLKIARALDIALLARFVSWPEFLNLSAEPAQPIADFKSFYEKYATR